MRRKFLIGLLLISLFACNKKDDCTDEVLTANHFETEYGCDNTRFALQVDLDNDVTIIRSKESYDTEVTGICHPDIDFTLYDLVIGKQSTANFNDTILYDFRKSCPLKELTLTVEIVQSDLTQPSTVAYHAIIPKLGDEETLNVIVNVK